MVTAQVLRPDWTPVTITLMVIGFVVAWPLGLAMLAYILWGDRIPEIRRHFGESRSEWRKHRRCGPHVARRSGNVAFDEYRQSELKRLEEERRKLDEELREFETFMADLRKARDEEEFERFRQSRRNGPNQGPAATGEGTTINL